MQQSPCFNSFSPEETSKLFPSIQRFNNGFCSPRTLFFGLGFSSSGQNSFYKKKILSKMKYSSSNKKQVFNNSNKPFLSNKRHFSSGSSEKTINKTNLNNKNINKTNHALNAIIKNEESIIESQNDGKKTKASSKNYSTYLPPKNAEGSNINYYNYGNYNNYNYGYITNSTFNKSAYIGSVKKNLLPSLSKELKSNTKNKSLNQNNNDEKNNRNNNNSSIQNNNSINKYNNYNSESQKKNKKSYFKYSINTSSKKTTNESTPYDYLFKITESLDLEKMVDYIVSSTKIYNRYNENKENYSNNYNNIQNINEDIENNGCKYNIISYYSDNKNIKKSRKNNSKNNSNSKNDSYNKNLNYQIDNQKCIYSICKCKKVECLKYSCSCLKSGNKCNNLCSCMNCKNKESNLFQIEE